MSHVAEHAAEHAPSRGNGHGDRHERSGDAELRGEIEALGLRTEETLRARRAIARAREAVTIAAPWTLVAPVIATAWWFVSREPALSQATTSGSVAHAAWAGIPMWLVIALALLPLVVLVVVRSGRVLAEPIDARAGLARLDHELDTHDALRTAHDFLARADRGPFEEAALVDGRPALQRARDHALAPAERVSFPRRTTAALLLSIALCVLLPWLADSTAIPRAIDDAGSQLARADGAHAVSRRDDAGRPVDVKPETPREPRDKKPGETSKGSKPEERAAREDQEREPRESTGKNGEGRSADASPSSNPSQSQGVPSSQSQPSTSADPSKSKAKKPKPKANKEDAVPPKKKPMQESGATAGRGVGSGSSKNPGATDWASKDQVSTDEEPPPAEDEDVDDEDSDSEARGGLQPNLRDRRPAVNRDLTIGFGNQPNPDANGRGGPSEQKKSRGVASLVLGVPIPDHVKGRPNPGRTKITQERVEPRAEDAASVAAGARVERTGSIGPVAHRTITPWMSTLVKSWFQRQRRQETKTP